MRKLINCHHVKKPLPAPLPVVGAHMRRRAAPGGRRGLKAANSRAAFAVSRFLPLSLMCLLIISDFQEQIANQYAQYSYDRLMLQDEPADFRSSQLLSARTPPGRDCCALISKFSRGSGREATVRECDRLRIRRSFVLLAAANPDENRLYEDLMMTYNRIVRPVQNNTERLLVRLSLKLSQLIDVVSRYCR